MVKIMENPIKMDDLGVPLFLETPISLGDSFWMVNFLSISCQKALEASEKLREYFCGSDIEQGSKDGRTPKPILMFKVNITSID